MSPVHLDELNPETRARVLEQLSGTETGTTALATVEQETLPTLDPAKIDSEKLGIFVRDGVIGVATKLVELKPYVEELWRRIDRGEVILGCSTKKEFCDQVLQRTPRAVRYMLEGGNHNRGGETVSPPQFLIDKSQTPMRAMDSGMPASLRDIRLELCSRTDPRYETIREDHYVENHGCIGRQAHYLIHYKGDIAGIISGASPVFATAPSDEFFGLNKENRQKFLQGIVTNVVFRLENHERNLASRVLTLWRHLIPHFWYKTYGSVVYGFETFVEETDTRKGTLYKVDNWKPVGTTAGVTKVRNGIEKPANNWKEVPPKLVYCRWRDGFTAPCSACTPEWVREMCDEGSGPSSCVENPVEP